MLLSIEQQQELQDKYIKLLQEASKEDTETAHIQADSIISELLEELWYSEVVEEYDKINKWYA